MKARSFAKINLGLEVIGKRKDGYHEIRTLFHTVDFFDTLDFSLREDGRILVNGDDLSIPWGEENLIFRAALLLKEKHKVSDGVEVRVKKNIPAGRGLGGGSSNAAVALYVLDKLWDLRLEREVLKKIGSLLGSDVPFFFEGGFCLGEGRGEKLSPLPSLPSFYCLLVLPTFPVSTASVYRQLSLTSEDKESKIIRFLKDKNLSSLENSLEKTVFRLYPQLKEIKDLLDRLSSELSLLSGTGSAVFGLFSEEEKALESLSEVKKLQPALLVRSLSKESYWSKLIVGV
ncbi:MAG: 4-(cytidine 5'-diphospho)-2-C-methyl-D-erythritol kinase [Candidatus Aminicenantales bacterium]